MAAGILLALFLRGSSPRIGWGIRSLMIVGGIVGIALTGHFAAPWGDGLPWRGTLISYPVVAICATAIVFAAIGIGFRTRPLEYLGKIS